jgi:hypothetical protein
MDLSVERLQSRACAGTCVSVAISKSKAVRSELLRDCLLMWQPDAKPVETMRVVL